MYLPSADTAMHRKTVSAPVTKLIIADAIKGDVCNWGSGRAYADTQALASTVWTDSIVAYDPQFNDTPPEQMFDTIYCGYVLNTLPEPHRWNCVVQVIQHMKPKATAFFAVRADKIKGMVDTDGVRTKRGTFQKSFTANELSNYLGKVMASMPNTPEYYKVDAMHFGHYVLGWITYDPNN